jgi:hypothetical protein
VDRKAWLDSLLDRDLVAVRVRLRAPDVVFVKGILEASEGLGALFAEPSGSGGQRDGGAVVIATPRSQLSELREVIADLRQELDGAVWDDDPIAES